MRISTLAAAFESKVASAEKSSSGNKSAGWDRFLLPSVADLLFMILLFSLTAGALAPRLLGDAGTGWHIRNGELILRSHTITRQDPFSFTLHGNTWYAWEWLYDAMVGGIHHWTGLNGVVLLTAFVVSLTFTFTFRRMLAQGASLPVSLVLLVLALGASAIHLFARPHVFSWLLAVLWFEILDSSEANTQPTLRMYWLPPIMLVWANLHGGFVLGFALCFIYLIASVVRLRQAQTTEERDGARSWMRRLAGVTALSAVGGLLNPYGYQLYFHIYRYLSDRFLMNHIDEFRSPDFHGAAQQCFAALLLIAITTFAIAGRRLRLSHVLIAIFAAYSGMYASRNLPISSLLFCLILAPVLSLELAAGAGNPSVFAPLRRVLSAIDHFSNRVAAMQMGLHGHLWPAFLLVLLMIACAGQGRLGGRQVMNAHFSSQRFPVEAVNFLQAKGIRDPIFSEDYWGGYLIYRLYPQNRVFIDDRHDFYGDRVLKTYLRIIHVQPGWEGDLTNLNPKWILMPYDATLTNILKEIPDWKVVYQDKTAVLFEGKKAETAP